MTLSRHIIFFRLSLKYKVYYLNEKNSEIEFMRPVFFTRDFNISNKIVMINPDDLKKLDIEGISSHECLFICCGNPKGMLRIPESTVIAFEEHIPTTEIFNELQEIFNLFEQWDETLKTLCYEEGNFSDMIDCCDTIMFGPVSLSDNMFRFIGYSRALSQRLGLSAAVDINSNRLSIDKVNEMLTNQKFSDISKLKGTNITSPFGDVKGDLLFKNIFHNNDYVGRLMIKLINGNRYQVKYNKVILEHLYIYIVKLYNKYLSFNKNEIYLNSFRSLLKDGLDKATIPDGQWKKALEENGWATGDEFQLIQFKPNLRYDKNIYAEYYSTEIEKIFRKCVCFEYQNNLLLFINIQRFEANEKMDLKQTLAYFLRESLMIAGISRVFRDIEYLSPAYKQTQIALEFGIRNSPSFWYHYFNDYALDYILSSGTGRFKPEQICSEKLLALKQYDSEKSTEYYETLLVYFQCMFNSTEASRRLYIQRSSFHYRMDRIQKLTGIDFGSQRELLYLAMSFELLRENKETEPVSEE